MGVTAEWQAEAAARWLAEAVETGDPLGPLPAGIAPGNLEQGEDVAFALLEALGQTPCGLRIGPDGVAGPMVEARLLRSGAAVALSVLRHPRASTAVIGVLAEALDPEGTAPPAFSTLHPALDLASTRFSEPPSEPALVAADLGGLGLVVAGKAVASSSPGRARVACGAPRARRWDGDADLAARLAEAASVARRLGGLPAGALLVVAGLTPVTTPKAGVELAARVEGLGRAMASFS